MGELTESVIGDESARRKGPRAVPGRIVSPSLVSFWDIMGNEVIVELESIGRWFRARLPEEAEERSEGVEDVLIDARLAIALEVLSRA
jgi:hypothetical protein